MGACVSHGVQTALINRVCYGLLTVQARAQTLKRLQVPNIIGSLPLQYSVYADADWFSGPASLSCASANRGDTYKLSVCPLVSGTHWGSITFMAPDGNYCWYSVEVRVAGVEALPVCVWCKLHPARLCPVQRRWADLLLGCCSRPCRVLHLLQAHLLSGVCVLQVRATEPPEEGSITASCPVHQALAIKVSHAYPEMQASKTSSDTTSSPLAACMYTAQFEVRHCPVCGPAG